MPGLRFEIEGFGTVAASGTLRAESARIGLAARGTLVGALVVGIRRGDVGLRRADRELLALIEPVLSVLAQSLRLSAALADSRSRIVEAAERERVRLQRDLHDGVASALTGVQFKLDATRALLPDSRSAGDVLDDAVGDLRDTLVSLRLVIDDLRPPELDRLGLAAALRGRWSGTRGRAGDRVAVDVDASVPDALPAAVEVTAYLIAVEATSNALRHSAATSVRIATGASNEEIARRLGVATKTVQNTISRVLAKLRLATRDDAERRARQAGLG